MDDYLFEEVTGVVSSISESLGINNLSCNIICQSTEFLDSSTSISSRSITDYSTISCFGLFYSYYFSLNFSCLLDLLKLLS